MLLKRVLVTGEGTMLPASQKILLRALAVPAARPAREHRSLACGGRRPRGALRRGAARSRSRTGVCGPTVRLVAAHVLEGSMPSRRRGRHRPPSAPPNHQTAKGAVRGAVRAQAMAARAWSLATAGSQGMCTQQRRARTQRPGSRARQGTSEAGS